ncbi:tRNA-(ms[2]io[6]A)-hydroxylase [Corallincola platygyrae]|uniref:tRNA-(Ms[2]io[6]A)-hydroxylase n=1 Tax=Corallincola platygyrae TaxID=1193278 RepID=A0ABW4XQZ9_9GAMM
MNAEHRELLAPIYQFLKCETPDQWIEEATKPEHLSTLLIDHANCELKAAQSAALLIRRYGISKASGPTLLSWLKPYEDFVYRGQALTVKGSRKNALTGEILPKNDAPETKELIDKMVRLIKEELHHFEQVLEIMESRDIGYQQLTAARYAKGLMSHVRTYEPAAAIDKLIIGAFIEARSCERFAKLSPYLDEELEKFYVSLLRSEARHYQDYLKLAGALSDSQEALDERVKFFAGVEASLISTPDPQFRFHSGVPEKAA